MNEQVSGNGVAGDQLRAFVERIQRLEEEIKSLNDDKKDVYAEAKGNGFDVKILKRVIRAMEQEPHIREAEETVFDLYWHAVRGGGEA